MPRRRTEPPRRRPRRDDDLRRRPPTKRGRAIILIVCEGVETEFRYFEAMRKREGLLTVTLEVARSGRQSARLVEQAVDLRQRRARQPEALPYEEVWCVFDREAAHEPADFSAAIHRADREQLALAVSNPCFEYWYLLHYRETDRPFHDADEVYEALRSNDCLPGYQKNQDVFDRLLDHREQALERAERLYERHPDRELDRFPNPSTLVQRLVRRLIEE
jgi:RloB-like protein